MQLTLVPLCPPLLPLSALEEAAEVVPLLLLQLQQSFEGKAPPRPLPQPALLL